MSVAEATRPQTGAEIAAALVGAWRLERFTVQGDGGEVSQPLGPEPFGQISYGADGHISVHLVKGQGAYGPTPMSDYSAYFGRFSVDAERRIVTHHVEGASFKALIGVDQPRGLAIEGDLLTLSAPLREGRGELVWRRLAPPSGHPSMSDDAFRAEVRAFIAANLPRDMAERTLKGYHPHKPDVLYWTARLQAHGWSVPNWPAEYGGPGWSVTQRHIFDEECFLAGCPALAPPGRLSGRPDHLHLWKPGAEGPLPAADPFGRALLGARVL